LETENCRQKYFESYIVDVDSKTGVEVSVIDWKNGEPYQVAVHFKDLGQMLTLSADGARSLAFLLMECADFVEPPFTGNEDPTSEESEDESISFFGPYDEDISDGEEPNED
jgi:hypothetical protein